MNKEELIEKGFMPKNVDYYYLYENGFEYKINGKYTLKLFDGTILCKNVDGCKLFENGFRYKIDEKYIEIEGEDYKEFIRNKKGKMNKEELIEKGFMPKNAANCFLFENGFEYEINGKRTLKLFDGTILCENVDYCYLYENGFEYKIDGKRTLKLFDGTILCENVDWCNLYKNGFSYEIDGKWTLKLFDGTILCENVDGCFLFENGFRYKIDEKYTEIEGEDYKEFIKNKKGKKIEIKTFNVEEKKYLKSIYQKIIQGLNLELNKVSKEKEVIDLQKNKIDLKIKVLKKEIKIAQEKID